MYDREASVRREELAMPIPPAGMAVFAFLTAVGAAWLIDAGSPEAISGGVLLAIAALLATAVLLGAEPYGSEVEGRLGLSVRLGLGMLGGFLGAGVATLAEWSVGGLGVTAALGVEISGRFTAGELGLHLLGGSLWGTIFGVVVPTVPGRGPVVRGLLFSFLPALWFLLKVFPVDRELGLFGSELGTATFLFVFLFWWLWGMVAGWVLAWGGRSERAPLDRPLGD